MPIVTVNGALWRHDATPFPDDVKPRLRFRPNASQYTSHEAWGMIAGTEVDPVKWYPLSGRFVAELYSDGTERKVSYTPVVSWLVSPGDDEREARGYTEFPRFFPDAGGNIADLWLNQSPGLAMWLVSDDAPLADQPYQMQLDPVTGNVYERRVV